MFEVLKRRHACRHFDGESISDETLYKLAYAAHRAPTGGNIPYRFVVVVSDPIQLRMLKAISPGHFGNSSAAVVICTNLRPENEAISKVDADQCSLYDAGAAAENVALAACVLGLGTTFVKSYSETAICKVLRLPKDCRTELVVSVGHPAPDEPAPVRTRKNGKITYFDTYGQLRNMRTDHSSSNEERAKQLATPEQYIFELALFLLTSAQISLSEPRTYPSRRLLDAISRLTEIYSRTDLLKTDEFLVEAKRMIDASKYVGNASEEKFAKFIDNMITQFVRELERRYGREDEQRAVTTDI